ncbi:hypothetical protein [Lederbergia lenta]|uniref:hypothetical protein n=1 Tax=Lederbergia lenta TaxID=1467 RepID=UPI00203C49DD|nr:hypothetical protein [Lederbergia lenta]MCM3113659.1 hypothetical protein [Lederbergia lenta]
MTIHHTNSANDSGEAVVFFPFTDGNPDRKNQEIDFNLNKIVIGTSGNGMSYRPFLLEE